MSSDFLYGLVTALIASVVAPVLLDLYNARQKRNALRAALCGEISALAEIAERRRYLPNLKQHIECLRKEKTVACFSFSATFEYFAVYKANIGNLGQLEASEAREVVGLYVLLQALLEDMNEVKSGERIYRSPEECIAMHEESCQILEAALKRANELSQKLRSGCKDTCKG